MSASRDACHSAQTEEAAALALAAAADAASSHSAGADDSAAAPSAAAEETLDDLLPPTARRHLRNFAGHEFDDDVTSPALLGQLDRAGLWQSRKFIEENRFKFTPLQILGVEEDEGKQGGVKQQGDDVEMKDADAAAPAAAASAAAPAAASNILYCPAGKRVVTPGIKHGVWPEDCKKKHLWISPMVARGLPKRRGRPAKHTPVRRLLLIRKRLFMNLGGTATAKRRVVPLARIFKRIFMTEAEVAEMRAMRDSKDPAERARFAALTISHLDSNKGPLGKHSVTPWLLVYESWEANESRVACAKIFEILARVAARSQKHRHKTAQQQFVEKEFLERDENKKLIVSDAGTNARPGMICNLPPCNRKPPEQRPVMPKTARAYSGHMNEFHAAQGEPRAQRAVKETEFMDQLFEKRQVACVDGRFVCLQCPLRNPKHFSHQSYFLRHASTHEPLGSALVLHYGQCPKCPLVLASPSSLRSHMSTVHGEGQTASAAASAGEESKGEAEEESSAAPAAAPARKKRKATAAAEKPAAHDQSAPIRESSRGRMRTQNNYAQMQNGSSM